MKNGLLIWNSILTLAVAFLLIKQLGSGKKTTAREETTNSGKVINGNQQFRIAYFEMDTIAANFGLVKELETELKSKEESINTEMARRSKELQEKYNYYQNLLQNGKLPPQQEESAKRELDGMNEDMKTRKQQLDQDYNKFMMTKQNEIKSKIEEFLKEYNKEKNFTYIVSYEQGLFYYKDTAYNITADLVQGLNARYKPGKK